MSFEPESTYATTHAASIYTKILGYFSIIQPLFMKFDQLLVREQASTAMGFEPELISVIIYRIIFHAQLASYLYIVHTFLVQCD